MLIEFTLNGKPVAIDVPPHITFLALLRDYLNLTGTKEGCGIGECGACSVLVDGKLVNSCLMLAPKAAGRTILTVEGVSGADGALTDLQQNFVDYGAVQCGFCTPGMVLAGEALLAESLALTWDEIRIGLSGNLCRCTGYQQIVDAIEATAHRRQAMVAEPTWTGG